MREERGVGASLDGSGAGDVLLCGADGGADTDGTALVCGLCAIRQPS